MSSFTKGPWEVVGDHDCDDALEITAEARDGKVCIAEIQLGFDGPFDAEQIANARLIAAAPELLDALLDLQISLRVIGARSLADIAGRAIARATGAA